MAEIKVEKKSPMWPWILLVIIVLGIIAFFVFRDNGEVDLVEDTPIPAEEEPDREPINNQTVASYVNFVQEQDPEMGLDHNYTNEALKRLTDATEAMADEVDVDIERDLSIARENARAITEDPFETTHANKIRMATDKLSDALQTIQQEEFPDLSNEATQVRNASANIDPEQLTLDQRDEVKSFFDQAASLLERMNR